MHQPHSPESEEHHSERTYSVHAERETSWDAIATAEGISAWMSPTQLTPQIGGDVTFDLDGIKSTGTITEYTPTTRFAYEVPWPVPPHPENMTDEMTAWFAAFGISPAEACRDLSHFDPIRTEFLLTNTTRDTCIVQIITIAPRNSTAWEDQFFIDMVSSTAPIGDGPPALLKEMAS